MKKCSYELLIANRKYKDTIFRWIFSQIENLLSLYNAVTGKHYQNPEELEIVTLENAIYMGMKNDLAFVLEMGLYLYEITRLTDDCDRFCKWADRFFGAVVTVGIGKVCNEVSNLRFSYEGAWEALSYRVIYGSGCSINIADIAPKGQGLSMQPDDINMNDVFKAVHIGVREDIEHAVFSLVKELKDNAKTIMQYNFTVLEIVGHLYRFCGNNHMKFEDHAGEIKNAYEEITKMDESALMAWLVRVALSISDELKNARNSSLRYLISEAKNIVRDEYADADLSLDTVCSKLGVSNSYFSSIFKKEVGISFITYLTDYRMQQAVHLMLETNEKNYEIAEHVGYEDANYFGYVFKRKYGMSPSKYRTEHMGK